ncbi:tetrathionate reductase subunit TtrA [Pollutimonas nitritireducens]|uniref:Tetrathionate reductase subunit TtrA n=1 Tax=Pollutimonas nitritireducens TaxID=2045209 RepID=A0A2N4UBI2_9BURK|nr:tetrathionate reductase subunit A [Pollutimonas nitritireducens]PLC52389.1 tetrathionate reductase subunit TtrA [Pollutimonas nitritireducens]
MSKKQHDNSHGSDNAPSSADRRKLLAHGGIAAGGLAAFTAGYGNTLQKAVKGLTSGSGGEPTAHAVRGNSLMPEFQISTDGHLSMQNGQVVSPSSCLGCWTQCGVRVRVDTTNNRIVRIAGNPYHPLATTRPASMDTPVREVYAMLGGDNGLEGRATSCARGSSMLEHLESPYRVLKPLKRVGPRGSGEWKTISFEQLVQEVCDGGDLFGEGHVDGLRALMDHETLIDPDNPEYGPICNQLVVNDASNEGRSALLNRFAQQSFGTINRSNHGSYCGQTRRIGAAAALGDLPGMPHGKPDWKSARFGLFIGAAPAQAGNPFQRQGRELAEARSRKENTFRYVVVSPILPTSSSLAAGSGNRWIGVNPGTDLALCMAMIDWIIENGRYDTQMLSQPGAAAALAAGEAACTNATHLLIVQEDHPRFGTFLQGADLGWPLPETGENADQVGTQHEDVYIVKLADGTLSAHTVAQPADLLVEPHLLTLADGSSVQVCSSFVKLRQEAARMSRADYALACGISQQVIEELADEFTSYGKQAVTDMHGGTMNGAGFYTAYAIYMLNTLVGNLNVKGGLVLDAGPFGPFGAGPRYNFAQFPGKVAPKGVSLSRSRFPYEKTSEYRRKLEQAGTPYPAKAPWYPAVGALSSEMLASGLLGYPYPVKIWLNHMSNPVYALCGFKNALLDKLRDPKALPLHISVNAFINETSAWADYIVPDTITYESWGIGAPWADVIARSSTVRWPTVEPSVARTADGQPVCLETFLIQVALRLKMPGFGEGVIKDKDGNAYDLLNAEDFYLRGLANMAFATGKPVGEASDDDMLLTGVDRYADLLQEQLKPEEWRRVAMLMTRGGRFDDLTAAWKGDQIRKAHKHTLNIWSEQVASMRHTMTGERYSGCPTYYPTRLGDGTPMRTRFDEKEWPFLMTSYKSNLMSSMSIGVDRLRQLHPHNPISLNRSDAARLGIKNGDPVHVVTPGGRVTGVALVREGIMPGAIAIEHGYGHTQLGTTAHIIDGKQTSHNPRLGAGVNLNDLGFADPSREEHANVWIDWVSGAAVRQGLPARVEPVRI